MTRLLADRDWIDHRLYRALVLVLSQDEHEFVRFVLGRSLFDHVNADMTQTVKLGPNPGPTIQDVIRFGF